MAYESYQSLSENNCFIDSTMNDACPKNSYRLVVLGAPKVGKSSILNWFFGKSVDHNYVPTIEDFHKKVFKIRGDVYRLDILDTSGNDPFPAMKKLNVMTGDMFILVFSLDNVDSYTQVKHLLQLIVELKKPTAKQDSGRHSSGNTSTVPILVVGNKLDLLMDNKVVQRCAELGDIQQMVASTCGPKIAIYSEISALNSMGIETAFERLFTLAALPHEMLPNRHRTVEVNSSVSAVAASNPQNVSNPTVDSSGKVVKTESTSNIDAEIGAGGGLINKRLSAKFASARSSSLKLRKSVHANNNNANNITADSASTATTASTNNKATESNGTTTTTTATPTPTTLKLSQAARKSFRKVTFRRAAAAESWGAVWLHARRPSIRAELKLLQLKKNPTTFKYHDYESTIGSSTAGSSSTSSSPTSKSPTSKSANSSFSEHTTKSLIPNGNSAVSRTKFRVLVDNFKNLVCSSDRSMKSSSKLL